MWNNLRLVHDMEVGVGAELQRVKELEAVWHHIEREAFAHEEEFRSLHKRVNWAAEPLGLECDLLGMVGRERDEVVHTRVLAKLINPVHAVGKRLLASLLRAVLIGDEFATIERLLTTPVAVEPEKRRALVKRKSRGRPSAEIIPDIVIRFGVGAASRLVVIENKIGIRDRERQLDDYREWAIQEDADEDPVLVYLTPEGDPPHFAKIHVGDWRRLAYRRLATAWRADLRELEGPWAEMLRFYIATIMKRVLRVPDIRTEASKLTSRDRRRLVQYLRAATGSIA